MCQGKPVWQVINNGKDFQKGNLNPYSDNRFPPQTKFTIIKTADPKYVLVIDKSGSMANFDRLSRLQLAVIEWLTNKVSDGAKVGIVSFR